MFSCLFSFLMKSREEHVNIFYKSMFIPISRRLTSHVKFSASLVILGPFRKTNKLAHGVRRASLLFLYSVDYFSTI